MNILIIEDEEFAARRLENMISEIDPEIAILAKLESVSGSIAWLGENKMPDLIFMDIHLEDNLSFAIFESVQINCPVVFTTATDEKSTKLFKQREIDFLLKPIIQGELIKIIEKYRDNPENLKRKADTSFLAEILKNHSGF